MQAMTNSIEIGTGKHLVAEFIIYEEGEDNASVIKRVQKTSCPLWKSATEKHKIRSALRKPICLEDHLALIITCITIAGYLAHFLPHHMPYFTIEYMGTDGDPF